MNGAHRVLSLAALLAVACTKASPESSPRPPARAALAVASHEERPEYRVELRVPEVVAAGSEGVAVVRVVAGAGFHVNAEYPMAFTFDEAEGLRLRERRVMLAGSVERTPCGGGADDVCEVRARLPFTTDVATRLSGLLAFSVCQPEKCLVEKVRLAVDVPVR